MANGLVRGWASGIAAGVLGVVIAIAPSGAAAADRATGIPSPRPTPGETGWKIDVASYGWFSGFRGTTATLPPLPAARVDLGFGDILENLDGAVMGLVYARRDQMILWGDLMYSRLSLDEKFATPISTSLQLSSSTLIASGGAGWSVFDDSVWGLDLLAGARLYDVDTHAKLKIPGLGITKRGDTDETWVDPMIGTRFSVRPFDRWYLTSWAFVGGFDVGSKLSWDLFGGVGYQYDDRITLIAGYRGLGVDYARRGYVYDVVQQGPIVGVKIAY